MLGAALSAAATGGTVSNQLSIPLVAPVPSSDIEPAQAPLRPPARFSHDSDSENPSRWNRAISCEVSTLTDSLRRWGRVKTPVRARKETMRDQEIRLKFARQQVARLMRNDARNCATTFGAPTANAPNYKAKFAV